MCIQLSLMRTYPQQLSLRPWPCFDTCAFTLQIPKSEQKARQKQINVE